VVQALQVQALQVNAPKVKAPRVEAIKVNAPKVAALKLKALKPVAPKPRAIEIDRIRFTSSRFRIRLTSARTLGSCLLALSLIGYNFSAVAADAETQDNPFLVDKPRWELGLGAAALSLEAYPASSESTNRAFALPYFIYRGDRVRMQDGNLTAVAVENRRYRVDLSIGAALNVNSEDIPLRAGLPDLDFLFELGPKIELTLWDKVSNAERRRQKLTWETALRAAFSTDFSSISSRGYVLNTQLEYEIDGFITPDTKLIFGGGPIWVTEKLGDYVYGVDEQFATDSRAAFQGRSGYLATNLVLGLRHRFTPNFQVFAALGIGLHEDAANRNSPLFEENFTTGLALGVAWALKTSKDTVQVME